MSYSLRILSNDEFEALPYRHSDIALGVADPKTNTAYVRYSSYPDLQKYLVNHEFDHLVEETPTDEIDGVRYKLPLFGMSPGLNNLTGILSLGSMLGQGFSSLARGGVPGLLDFGKRATGSVNQMLSNPLSGLDLFSGGIPGSNFVKGQPRQNYSAGTALSDFGGITSGFLKGANTFGVGPTTESPFKRFQF